jgi:fibronectin-binding autotransporter adhesin
MRHAQPSRILFIAIVFLTGLALPTTHAQQVSTSWNGGTGNWSVSTDWTPTAVPNNGGGTTYSVTISAASSAVSMDVLNDTIDNLTLGAANALTVNAGDSLSLVSGSSSNYGTLTNNGTLNGFVGNQSGASLINNGTVYGGAGGNAGTITNNGTIYGGVQGVSPFTGFGGIINNYGTVNGGVLTAGSATNYGTVNGDVSNAGTGETIINFGTVNGSLSFGGSSSSMNYGTVNGDFLIHNGFPAIGVSTNYGTVNGTFGASGDLATSTNYGTVKGGLNLGDGSTVINNGTIINSGAIIQEGMFINASGAYFSNSGLYHGTSMDSKITNAGTFVNVSGGVITLFANGLVNSGTLTNASGASFSTDLESVTNSVGGVLNNSGTFTNNGTITNNGMIINTIWGYAHQRDGFGWLLRSRDDRQQGHDR